MDSKRSVAEFWDDSPCGAEDAPDLEIGSREYYEVIERARHESDDFVPRFMEFETWANKRVLEIGCGVGTDFRHFARAGARATGIDMSRESLSLARRSLEVFGLPGVLMVADGEHLPFADNSFDLVYSWGVIHHSPEPEKIIQEIHRVLKPRGHVFAMVYNRKSIFALQVWLYYGVLRGNPFVPPRTLISRHVESPETKAYSTDEVARLFGGFDQLSIRQVVTGYDLRIGRRIFLPKWLRKLVPSRFGWFTIVQALEPSGA